MEFFYVVLAFIGVFAWIMLLQSYPDIHKTFFGLFSLSLGLGLLFDSHGSGGELLGGLFLVLLSIIFFSQTKWWQKLFK
jgi:hypothetical protein